MITTPVSGPGRVAQIIWGSRLQNALTFAWPAVLDEPKFWRAPRAGSEQVSAGQTFESWTTAYDWRASFTARWFGPHLWAGGAGLQAFLDWAADGNAFTFVPDAGNAPLFTVPGCYLEEPFDSVAPALEQNGLQSLPIAFRNPTYDMGLAWRGLWFEYVPGADLAQASGGAGSYGQGQATGFYDSTGMFRTQAAGKLRDRHYPFGYGGPYTAALGPLGPRVALLEGGGIPNKLTFPEDLTNAAWVKGASSAVAGSPANTPASPRGDATAVLIKEDGTNAVHYVQQGITLGAATNTAGFTCFVRAAGRTKARIRITNTGGNEVSVNVDLALGTITAQSTGVTIADIRPLAAAPFAGFGWFVVTAYGTPGGSTTGATLACILHDNTGGETYTGDGASGMYFWGIVATDNRVPRAYWGTGAQPDNDSLSWPVGGMIAPQPMFAYVKFTELGAAVTPGLAFPNLIQVGNSGAGLWRFLIYGPSDSGAANYSASSGTIAGSPNVQADVVAAGAKPVYGDSVEVLALWFADGHPEIYMSKNGGAVTSAVAGTPNQKTISGAASGTIGLGGVTNAGHVGYQKIKVGPLNYLGTVMNTLPLARAL